MGKLLLLVAMIFVYLPQAKGGSWSRNQNGGFGLYVPEGWHIVIDGRRSIVTGPEREAAMSSVLVGSDWNSRVRTPADLADYAKQWLGHEGPFSHITHSGLPALLYENGDEGAVFAFREAENVVVIDYRLRGSQTQRDEGRVVVSSIEIRTDPIENLLGLK